MGNAALVILAVLAMGAVVTVLGPVLQPFLVALFLFYATQFGAKSFSRLGMRPWTAYLSIVSLALIFTILTAQLGQPQVYATGSERRRRALAV